MIGRREKVFGPGQAVPLDRNAKVRIEVYARACNARLKQGRQHRGPLTGRALDVLNVLVWVFHNAKSGSCYPSYERIAEAVAHKFGSCARSTVAEALKALEWVGVLSWQNRIVRIRERCQDLFGANGWRWRVIRTSNAYIFRDPKQRPNPPEASKSETGMGTLNQESSYPYARSAGIAAGLRNERSGSGLGLELRQLTLHEPIRTVQEQLALLHSFPQGRTRLPYRAPAWVAQAPPTRAGGAPLPSCSARQLLTAAAPARLLEQ